MTLYAVPKPPAREKPEPRGLTRHVQLETHTGLQSRTQLAEIGSIRKRNRSADRLMEMATHALACSCGCNSREISRAHLESRAYESTRNLPWNNLPACPQLHHWLDATAQGVQARACLLDLARDRQERLDHADALPIISVWGYYTWLHDREEQMR